jgi:hypothetical protein
MSVPVNLPNTRTTKTIANTIARHILTAVSILDRFHRIEVALSRNVVKGNSSRRRLSKPDKTCSSCILSRIIFNSFSSASDKETAGHTFAVEEIILLMLILSPKVPAVLLSKLVQKLIILDTFRREFGIPGGVELGTVITSTSDDLKELLKRTRHLP